MVVVLAVARLRGLYALIGLAFSAAVITRFMLPSLLSGESGILVGVVGASAIMFVVLYTTHGWSLRTSAALGGTLAGIGLTGLIASYAVAGTRLTGVADEGGRVLGTFADDLSFPGLLTCAIIVAGLGVLNDVTITQASAVWEIRAAAPGMSRRAVFASGMRIGRDHIASTIYTIVFAYAGTALLVLLRALALRPALPGPARDRGDRPGGRPHPGDQHRPGARRAAHHGDRGRDPAARARRPAGSLTEVPLVGVAQAAPLRPPPTSVSNSASATAATSTSRTSSGWNITSS